MRLTFLILFILILVIAYIGGLYKIFKKADEKGWKAFIPIYNLIVLLKIVGKPRWFVVFLIVPIISDLIMPYILINTYRRFDIKRFLYLLFGILFSFIFIPIVGFSDKYKFDNTSYEKYNFSKDLRTWILSIVFALISVLFVKGLNVFWFQNYKLPTSAMENTLLVGDHIFVNKATVGPRLPITPLALPFYQNTIPYLNIPSYTTKLQLPYTRLFGSPTIERNDVVVFNFPEGDTVCLEYPALSYYSLIRMNEQQLSRMNSSLNEDELKQMARQQVWDNYTIIYRPIDRMDSYIKRCVGVPGDSIRITKGTLYVNDYEVKIPETKYRYIIKTDGTRINNRFWKKIGVNENDLVYNGMNNDLFVNLSDNQYKRLKELKSIASVSKETIEASTLDIFPHTTKNKWSPDNFGTIYIPKKGDKVKLTLDNIDIYKRMISVYEENKLEISDSIIFINGNKSDDYTFKMDYYWMMGDNRHNSLDSRYWGFVPENHIIGKVSFIWWSMSNDYDIRWERILKKVE
jgi:signal peptidase I